MKNNKKNLSIRNTTIFVFITFMIISISSIGYLVFSRWYSSSKQTTERIAEEMNDQMYSKMYSFLHVPEQINDSSHKILANNILDLLNEDECDKFFVGVLSSYEDEIYSFSYGTTNGNYYGARRNENGSIEIMKSNAATGGESWYYSVNEDLTAGELVFKAGKFDPRTRDWYKSAIESEAPTFSPIYKHFIVDDLTVSFACPVYDEEGTLQGVLGTHILLNKIGTFLKDTVEKYNGYAVILEKSSNDLIANSMEINNFVVFQDRTLQRNDISAIQNVDFQEAYEQYKVNAKGNFFYEGKDNSIYINVKEIHMSGLDWVVISAIPEDYLISTVVQSIRLTILLSTILILLSFIIYIIITRKLLKPMTNLLKTTYAFSTGDFTKRIDIVRNDEIGIISESFNKVATKVQFLVNNLEDTVKERTDELSKTNKALEESKNHLNLILNSSGEAIYGTDLEGKCTFCNPSCFRMLGYNSQEDLLGKNMHLQIHHSRRDGTPLPIKECKIFYSFQNGEGQHADDEVFWKSDGTSFDVEYYSYPQIRNGKVIGSVVTFMDISSRKKKEAEIEYLSCHDLLTGLNNRRCFEDHLARIDNLNNLPLSVIFADINGLKMTNDIFGHSAGDELIKKSSEILKLACRENDFIARIGGDEFIILLPKTSLENAEKIIAHIKSSFFDARIEAIKCSISLGLETKTDVNQTLEQIMSTAENAMYKDKTMNRKSNNKSILNAIIETLHSRYPREKLHSINVAKLCTEIGTVLHLSETDVSKLQRSAYLHDIGKIVLEESILLNDNLNDEEHEEKRQHSIVGYRILNLFDETLDIAEYVYGHHERWDGTGYPKGFKGEQIPLISRIIAVAEAYDRVLNRVELAHEERKLIAIDTIIQGSGTHFDPQISELFIQLIREKNDII